VHLNETHDGYHYQESIIDTSQGICVKERQDLNCDGVEMLWIEVLIPNFKLLVCVVYRPPRTTASFWDSFDYSLEQALNFTNINHCCIVITYTSINIYYFRINNYIYI
jgi:hypothetical protein